MSFNFAPDGWALCNGQLLSISANAAIFSLLGTQYGGDGIVNFALPNLQGRVPMHAGTLSGGANYTQGSRGGELNHTLLTNEMPAHTHPMSTSMSPTVSINETVTTDLGTTPTPGPLNILAAAVDGTSPVSIYMPGPSTLPTTLPVTPSGPTDGVGQGQAHSNTQPYLVLNYIIALVGIYPTQS